ncbi:alpha/beta hydrolase [Actinomadura keratinilytica]|uniref:Alpha/beta hydrolase family protein n=1 Tax=Actinomadura keratinilytica TaxID=547461 RepID=A0ABP7YYW2_9ACTN
MCSPTPRRFLAVGAALAAVAATSPGTGPGPYAPPQARPPLSPRTLDARYAAVRGDIQRAYDIARAVGDGARTEALRAFLAPGRRFLAFDARGRGRAVEVVGDLAQAERIAVVVPGADGRLTNFDDPKWAGGGARAVHRQARQVAPGVRLAVVAWLGYASPSTASAAVLTPGRAADGARELRRFVAGLHAVNGRARVALLCHSYGSVVCVQAARAVRAEDIALYGSPGVTASSVTDMHTGARVWAGRADGDWTRYVPKLRVAGLGFGPDPVSPSFGALRFAAGAGAHSEYLRPGSVSLRNLTFIALGRISEVTHA